MQLIKLILYPILIIIQTLYCVVIDLRNILYKYNFLTITKFKTKIISVGSLKIGGAGKTPLVEYLIKEFNQHGKLAILSRGYKRKSKGFLIAKKTHTAHEIGDESCQIKNNHPNLLIAVSENRVHGVKKIITQNTNIKTIILDDGHQHRKLARDLNIIVTEYDDLYSNDKLFPLGNLRDNINSANRAQIIVVTKCPKKISLELKKEIEQTLAVKSNQKLFFSYINYKKLINVKTKECEDLKIKEKYFLLTGIGNSKPLLNYLTINKIEFEHFKYPDHYFYRKKDIKNLIKEGGKKETKNIIITEKDFNRLTKSDLENLSIHFNLFYLKIEFDFNPKEKLMFNKQIRKFI